MPDPTNPERPCRVSHSATTLPSCHSSASPIQRWSCHSLQIFIPLSSLFHVPFLSFHVTHSRTLFAWFSTGLWSSEANHDTLNEPYKSPFKPRQRERLLMKRTVRARRARGRQGWTGSMSLEIQTKVISLSFDILSKRLVFLIARQH